MLIESALDLLKINDNLSGEYLLCGDIELGDDFFPIGSQFEPFQGVFNGGGHTISNVTSKHNSQYAGLFAVNEGVIKNLNVACKIEATAYVGGIASLNKGKIIDCSVSGEIRGTSFVGGFAGMNVKPGEISGGTDCLVTACEKSMQGNGAAEIFVSPDGSDENAGNIESPFKTLERAKLKVRELINGGSGDITVFLREGEYFIDSPVTLDADDCFNDGRTVAYSGYADENASLIGGRVISEWENYKGKIKRAFVGENADFRLIYVNGEPNLPARSNKLLDFLKIRKLDNVYAYYSHGWFSEYLRVSKLFGKNIKTFIPKSAFSGKANYLCGAVEFIKKDGGWALGADGYLYFRGDVSDKKIIAPTVKRIFSLDNCENIVIKNLDFSVTDFAIDFTAQGGRGKEGFDEPENTHGAVYLENSSHCSVLNNKFNGCGLCGVTIQGESEFNKIESNEISNIGFTGVYLCGNWIDDNKYISKHNLISDNHIYDVGKFAVNGAGIYVIGSGHNHVYRNLIHDAPRYGVSVKGARYGCWKTDCNYNLNDEILFSEQWNYLHSRNNVIEGNRVYDVGKNSADGGGIEAWGSGRDNVIDRNIVSDFYNGKPTLAWKGHGIFLDDATHYFTVTNNVVYESDRQGADASTFMKSVGIVVRNNIFDVTNTHQGAANISPYLEPCRDQVFKNNIVYADPIGGIGEDGAFIDDRSEKSLDRRMYTYDTSGACETTGEVIVDSDKNLFWNTKGGVLVSLDNNKPEMDLPLNEFIKKTGLDKNSVVADPLFTNAPERDYRLKENSPAFKLGFKQIDMENVGLISK